MIINNYIFYIIFSKKIMFLLNLIQMKFSLKKPFFLILYFLLNDKINFSPYH